MRLNRVFGAQSFAEPFKNCLFIKLSEIKNSIFRLITQLDINPILNGVSNKYHLKRKT